MITIKADSQYAIETAARLLNQSKVIAAPTETVYGLLAKWNDEAAISEIYRLKHRPHDKRLQMLAYDLDAAKQAGLLVTPELEAIAKAFWPGPLTVVANATDGDTIGLRIPNHPFMLELLRRLRHPVAATSANLSGTPPAVTPEDAVKSLNGKPAALFDGGTVSITNGTASTVASILDNQLTIIRPGLITLEQLKRAIDNR